VRPIRHSCAGRNPGHIGFILISIISAFVKALAKHSHKDDHIDQTNAVLSNSMSMRLSSWPGFLPAQERRQGRLIRSCSLLNKSYLQMLPCDHYPLVK